MLMSNCTSGGCGAKIGPGELSALLDKLKTAQDDALIVGFDTRDDAAVYKISADCAVISTVDFFSPMVDDAALFGKIAAANALSDIYAMGGTPIFALNLLCVPQKLDKDVVQAILSGGAAKLLEAGVPLAGGHSIYDHEIKYGLSVTGKAPPDKILRNDTPCMGDVLVLTKPLGVGIILAAHRAQLAAEAHVAAATASMERLNKYAADIIGKYPISACTDVTGFGLLAHACEMIKDTCAARLDIAALPVLEGAYGYAAEYLLTAAGQRNRHYVEKQLGAEAFAGIEPPIQELMLDPQTSGGLLFCAPRGYVNELMSELRKAEPNAAVIGEIIPKNGVPIEFQGGIV